MRTKIFSELYMMLEKVVPQDMLNASDDDIDYYLMHDFNDNVSQRLSISYLSKGLISIGTYFQQNGDTMCDPEMIIAFCHERKVARVKSFYLSTVAMYDNFNFADIVVEETLDEKDANNYLSGYLKELVARLRQDNSFLKKIYKSS